MIQINGYESYQAWVDAGTPGAVSFDAQGNRKERPATYLLPPPKRCACGVIIRDESFDQCAVHRPRVSRQLPCSFKGCGRRVISRDLCYLHLATMQARERLRASGSLR